MPPQTAEIQISHRLWMVVQGAEEYRKTLLGVQTLLNLRTQLRGKLYLTNSHGSPANRRVRKQGEKHEMLQLVTRQEFGIQGSLVIISVLLFI